MLNPYIFVILKENRLDVISLSKEDTIKMIKEIIIDSTVDEIEISVLQEKEDILTLGKELVTLYAKAERRFTDQINNDVMEEMSKVQSAYTKAVLDIEQAMKAHRYIKQNARSVDTLVSNWLKSDNEKLSEIYMEIEEFFTRKELDKKDKDK